MLSSAKFSCINIHPSLLPQYRGPVPTAWAIENGEKHFGITIHLMDEGIDTGDILKIFDVKIIENEVIKSLRVRFEPIMTKHFVETIIAFLSGDVQRKPQNEVDGKQYYIMDDYLKKVADQYLQ